MTATNDDSGARYADLAEAILRRHERGEAEANITSAVRDFLIGAGLAQADEIEEEVHPSDLSRKSVDLTALDTYVEFKRRTGWPQPEAEWIEQIDGYLEASQEAGRGVRLGVLTDGRHWFLRWPGAGPVRTGHPYAFVLDGPERGAALRDWLRDHALGAAEHIRPSRETIADRFGTHSVLYQRDLDALRRLYAEHRDDETIQVKQRLWLDLLRAAVGEVANLVADPDDLFVRHTYLTAVTGIAVQARFRIDVADLARDDPGDLLIGRRFRDVTGLRGIVETDFFAWPAEVGGEAPLATIARRLLHFDWEEAPADIAAILYETIIPADERRQLGEYYTPEWLARTIVDELIDDPLHQRVLDPACGSGTFIAEAVRRYAEAAEAESVEPAEALAGLREAVVGIDVHPVAVHLARSAWTFAAQPLVERGLDAGYGGSVSAPVYLGDSLQLRFDTGDLFAEAEVRIAVGDAEHRELVFPTSLVERADEFDAVMMRVADQIVRGADPLPVLDAAGLNDRERSALEPAVRTMEELHASGRNHIWAYYTRNLVRPVALARRKADVIVGNPPWLNYNQTVDVLRDQLERLSKDMYDIWVGGRYATHQDVAGLFYARCVDLYLSGGGAIGMVMPRSALDAGQHERWRRGRWTQVDPAANGNGRLDRLRVDFQFKRPWDLDALEPNDFFPIPSCVVFARRLGADPTRPPEDGDGPAPAAPARPLAGYVERWEGRLGAPDVTRRQAALGTDAGEGSPYREVAAQGATLVPRRLFLVEEVETRAVIQARDTIMVNPRRGRQDKTPWRDIDLRTITSRAVEKVHVFNAVLGESIAPYVTFAPLLAVLPVRRDNGDDLPANSDDSSVGGVNLLPLGERMQERWKAASAMWDEHKQPANRLSLIERLDYHRELSRQLAWRADADEGACRIVYSKSGRPTAARLRDRDAIVDHTLYWMPCESDGEAAYLLAVINSDALRDAAAPFMSRGLWGARDLHKHLWALPIPRFDPGEPLHAAIAAAGEAAAEGAALQLEGQEGLGSAAARRIVRDWLADSDEGREVERVVSELLGVG